MEIACTYWEADDGLFVGYLNDYPDHLTQSHDLAELEDMLADLYQIRQEEEKRLSQKRKTGILGMASQPTAAVGGKPFGERAWFNGFGRVG
ncbi:MAG: hypothetical protein FWB79_02100 [Treponema sp.]|nr:hypothetical protein [Treponema sp.]MCL2190762.1 hypothetical protein [Treponema sp.]